MKLWFTLAFGTVAISASMTYLVMHQGGQTLAIAPAGPAPAAPSQAGFDTGRLEGNVLVLSAGGTIVGQEASLTLPIKCIGSAPLQIELLRITCSCVHPLTLNGKELESKKPVDIAPGETGLLKIRWTPKEDQAKMTIYRFSLIFLTNDPQYSPNFRVEVETQVHKEGTK